MPWRSVAFGLALSLTVSPGWAALVPETATRPAEPPRPVFAMAEPVHDVTSTRPWAEAPLTAPLPTSVALFGAALCGLGLVYRHRR